MNTAPSSSPLPERFRAAGQGGVFAFFDRLDAAQRTELLAQAAEVDLLTEGRFRLGVAVGWNHVEYEALGQDFSSRGRRLDEQIELMRRLWTERSVTFEGEFDRITGAGIAPLPVQRPIPIWIGEIGRAHV